MRESYFTKKKQHALGIGQFLVNTSSFRMCESDRSHDVGRASFETKPAVIFRRDRRQKKYSLAGLVYDLSVSRPHGHLDPA